MSREDANLLKAWRQGDLEAGELLFERYYAAVVRFFGNKVVGDPADLIQEAFEECIRSRDRVRESDNFRSFLFGVAYNVLRRYYERLRRHDARFEPSSVSVADMCAGPVTMVATRDEHRQLLEALRRIPMDLQVVLELFYWEDMTSAQIAEALGWLGKCLAKSGNHARARETWKSRIDRFGERHSLVIETYDWIACDFMKEGNTSEARRTLDACKRRFDTAAADPGPAGQRVRKALAKMRVVRLLARDGDRGTKDDAKR